VTRGTTQDTIVLEYNDAEGLATAFDQYPQQIAAVIVEPVAGNMGCVTPHAAFLEVLRQRTREDGSLLSYDEVMTGFRVAYGGAQSLQGIEPDLTTLGKIVGGGLPLGAYGGRADVMDHVLPAGKVFQAGTLSGNPIATAAGIVTLRHLRDDPPYAHLEAISERLASGLALAADDAGLDHSINRVGSMMTLFFHPESVCDWTTASRCDLARFGRYFWGLLQRGVYMPCSQFEAMFISAAHTEVEIEATIQAAEATFQTLASDRIAKSD
jgi:glutamate-1-semialdehyde 2,1-aminomutase